MEKEEKKKKRFERKFSQIFVLKGLISNRLDKGQTVYRSVSIKKKGSRQTEKEYNTKILP